MIGEIRAYLTLGCIPDMLHLSEVRVWATGGDLIHTLSGHTSFVYSLSALPNGDLVSAGEDRTVRVWRGMVQFLCD